MPKISKQVISPKMFRHFAAITLVATGSLAMFANGENRQAMAAAVEAEQQAAEQRQKEFVKPVKELKLAPPKADSGSLGSFYEDTADRGPGPTVWRPPVTNPGASTETAWSKLGMTLEEWEALSQADRALLLSELTNPDKRDENGTSLAQIRRNQTESLIASSRERSGSGLE
jgi:hypothetical protein